MSIYTKRRCSPQRQHNIVGQRRGDVCSQAQHMNVPGTVAEGLDWPFPSKPVSHRRLLDPIVQDSFHLYDFEKVIISKQTRGHFLPQQQNSNGIIESPGSHDPSKDLPKLPSGEMQISRAIHAKQLMLQEKLWRVEEKIRQKLQRGSAGTGAGDDQKREEESHNRGPKTHTKTRLSQHHKRESVKSREDLMQERRQEDVKQLRKKLSQRNEDRIRNAHEEERGRWKNREMGFLESSLAKIKGKDETHDIKLNKQRLDGELNKPRWQNVKEHTKIQGNQKDNHNGGEAGVRSQGGLEKAKERELQKAFIRNIGLMRESQFKERTFQEMYDSDNEQDMPQLSQHKTAHRLETENHRGAEGQIFEESSLPPVSNSTYSNRPTKGELGLIDTTDASFQFSLCRICNRTFASGRLEKHAQICKKVNQSHRKVFNSYNNRTKGSAIEEFWKTHSRSKSPEVSQETFYPI